MTRHKSCRQTAVVNQQRTFSFTTYYKRRSTFPENGSYDSQHTQSTINKRMKKSTVPTPSEIFPAGNKTGKQTAEWWAIIWWLGSGVSQQLLCERTSVHSYGHAESPAVTAAKCHLPFLRSMYLQSFTLPADNHRSFWRQRGPQELIKRYVRKPDRCSTKRCWPTGGGGSRGRAC